VGRVNGRNILHLTIAQPPNEPALGVMQIVVELLQLMRRRQDSRRSCQACAGVSPRCVNWRCQKMQERDCGHLWGPGTVAITGAFLVLKRRKRVTVN
jgi:hypothetical protein